MSLNSETQEQQVSSSNVSLLDEIMAQSRMSPESEAYGIAKQGVAAFISNLLLAKMKKSKSISY